jgi:antitoxin component YwqK of YwqJK toxin-antitoxin module
MRYVGKDDTHMYLKCGHCRKVYPYAAWPGTQEQPEKVCVGCKKPFRIVFFRPIKIRFEALQPWLPPLIMALLLVMLPAALNSRFLLHYYQFNLIITTSNSLLSSIVATMIGAVLSEGLSRMRPNAPQSGGGKTIPTLVLIAEAALLIFLINATLTVNYGTLSINDPDTNELQQYFGATVNGCASGEGRLFDLQGNLIYYGGFNNNQYDGHGVKYELVNDSSNVSSASYHLVYEGHFKNGQYDGQGREYRYDAVYSLAKDADKDPHLCYEGEFSNGKYCGSGIKYGTDETYRGGFFEGTYNGYGTRWNLTSSRVYSFIGYFRDGKLNGRGTKFYPSGQMFFDGDYVDDYGVTGTFYYEDGTPKYQGELENDKYSGNGTLYWSNGTVRYEGEWREDARNGNGTSYREDGTKQYEGGWDNNTYAGYGISYFEDGTSIYYDGRWSNGRKNGYGIEYYKSGAVRYEGDWQNGDLYGKAKWYWENGTLFYDGDFVEGKMSGYGNIYFERGALDYSGDIANEQRNGHGTSYRSDLGTKSYSGSWADNNRSGSGTSYREDGVTEWYVGEWANGERSGYGTSYWEDGVTKQYVGEWANGKRSGQGTEFDENGVPLHEGTFENGEFVG